jgi:FtsZ-binding cell division protein ZapB
MPTPRQYANAAQRQAAYRRRTAQALCALQEAKDLPQRAAIASMPSSRRWDALIQQACRALQTVHQEIEEYWDARSEVWQESDRAVQMQEFLERIAEAIGVVEELR